MAEGCVKDATNKVRHPLPSRGPRVHGRLIPPSFAAQDGQTALHCAALKGHVQVVMVLMAEGCDMEVADKVRRPPLPRPHPGCHSIQWPARMLCRREMVWSTRYLKRARNVRLKRDPEFNTLT